MLGLGLALPEAAGRGRGTPATPAAAVTTIVIEGDSITSGMPDTPNGFYSYRYRDDRPDKTIRVRAQGSRSVGSAAELNDDGNTLIGNVAEDAGYGPQLLTAMIGANDLALGTAAAYRANLAAYHAALKAARPGLKFAWSGPIAYNPTGTPHPSKANFDAQRASLFAAARDPAVWGQWADLYLPLGEYPDFGDPQLAAALFGDGVHPSAAGQALLHAAYRPALDTILDPARTAATRMYEAAWPAGEDALATATPLVRRFVVAGIAHAGIALGAGVSGGDARIRLNGGSYGTRCGTGADDGHRLYNGDVIDLTLTSSASPASAVSVQLTVGSETRTLTFTTAADVPATNLVPGGLLDLLDPGSASHAATVAFPATGLGLIAVSGEALPTAVTYKGVAATLRVSRAPYTVMAVYTVPVTDPAPGPLVVSYAGARRKTAVHYSVIEHADPVPVRSYAPAQDPNTIPTWTIPAITVPARGLAIGFLAEYGGAGAPAGTVATGAPVFEGYGSLDNGDRYGVLVGQRATSGPLVFRYDTYTDQPMVALVVKAAGT